MNEFFKEIVKAVSDFKFYKEIKDSRVSKSLKYIFSLIFLITLILSIRYNYDINRGLDIAMKWTEKNLPPIGIQNGLVSVDVEQPYKIIEEDFAFIIDTTGQITSLDDYKGGILLMRDKLMYKESDVKTETYSLSKIKALKIDGNFMKALKKNAIWIILPIILVLTYITFCIAKFFQVLCFSIISIATSSTLNVKLTYKQLFNIGIYAITASTLLGAILAVLGIALPLFWIIYCGLYIIYLIMAILNCRL